ncbi:hypothetical protein [Caballeronia sp. LZ034LL]|uniref:hypothetical protein n=1 Tax=Caballeronia sp. LZ034LL TaxID=3038567 RepID=UPI00285FD2E3|nr:hypothetical protein [Caballeronia sp. LZ034LL]MDR5837500.1 hypothetical protein [Caballeronia sp. LZ034LL]
MDEILSFQCSLLMQKKILRTLFSILLVAIFYIAVDFVLQKLGVYLIVNQVQRSIVNAVAAVLLLFATQRVICVKE